MSAAFSRRRALRGLGLGLIALCGPAPALAQSMRGQSARDIGVGDPLRRTLLDAVRPAVEADLGQPVRFVVRTLRVQGDWAFAGLEPQSPGGGAIDYGRTRYAAALREGVFDGGVAYALLRRTNGTWRMRELVVGPTDLAYESWPEAHGAPHALFGLSPR